MRPWARKNAGPFELTIDVVFEDKALLERVRATGVLGPALFAQLYGIAEDQVLFTAYPAGYAFKATMPRAVSATPTCTARSSTRRCSMSRCPCEGGCGRGRSAVRRD